MPSLTREELDVLIQAPPDFLLGLPYPWRLDLA